MMMFSINLVCRIDNTAPFLSIDSLLSKTWYNTIGGIVSYAGTAVDNLGTYNSGITNSSFKYSQYDWTTTSYIITNASFEVELTGSTWSDNDEILTINDANVTLTVYVWDRCNNTNSASIQIWHDDTPPTITYTDPTAGADTPFYIPADESTTIFDIDFGITGGQSFYSGLTKAEYRTDDGTGWVTIFDNTGNPLSSDYTTDWQILDWFNSLFNDNNTIDLRVTDEMVSISVEGDEGSIPQPSLYDWNGSDFLLSFTFNSSTVIDYIYIYSDANLIEQRFTQGEIGWQADTPGPDLHSVTDVSVSYDIGNTGNRSIYVRAQNNAGLNSSWIEVRLFVDEEDPTISFQSITEVSWKWTIHPIGNILYYSELMSSNYADFTVTVNPVDTGSGMTNGYVVFELFSGIPSQQVTDKGSFNVTASTSNGTWISAYAVDASGRSSTTDDIVQVIKDNTKPSTPLIAQVLENSEFLFYDGTLFFSNTHSGSEPFTVNITSQDTQAGLENLTGSFEFGETLANRADNTYDNGFQITYYVDPTESAASINCVVYDNVGNSDSVSLSTVLDNGKPTNLMITTVTESSEFIYYDGSILYYSNDQSMNDAFTISLTALEALSGIQNVTGSLDFGETRFSTDNSSGTFDLTYNIGEGETASGAVLTLIVYDNVGNSESISLTSTLDNDAPTLPIITGVSTTSQYLYYDGATTLYYTNNKAGMAELFTLHFTTSDALSDLQKAVGSNDFSETPQDPSYSSGYDLPYTVSETEHAGGDNQIIATVYDNVGNTVSISLTCTIDNAGPIGVVINDVIVQSGAQYLYYDSGNEILYYSNNQPMTESFTVQVTASDAISGKQKANASEFNDDVTNSTYGANGYELTFDVQNTESAPTFTITVWDHVGNPTNVVLNTFEDNAIPQNLQIITVLESSDYLYYDGTDFFFSNNQSMTATFTIRVTGTDGGAGLKNATGDEEFNDVGVGDNSYTTYYELNYEIVQTDGVSDGAVTITLFDLVGNPASIDLTCYEDNEVPNVWLENNAVSENSDFTYYIGDGTQILWYSNQMSTDVDVDITVSTTDSKR
jgi:hypothetical protein